MVFRGLHGSYRRCVFAAGRCRHSRLLLSFPASFSSGKGQGSDLSQYPSRITGAAFNAEIGFYRSKFWLADEGKRRLVRTSDLRSVRIQPNGYTKLVLRLRKDLLIPTSHSEAIQLVKALNALLSERRAVEQRNRDYREKHRRLLP